MDVTRVEFRCEKERQQDYEKEPIQRRTDHRDSLGGRGGSGGAGGLCAAEHQRDDVLQVALQNPARVRWLAQASLACWPSAAKNDHLWSRSAKVVALSTNRN